jgi:hypothetical protein
VFLVADTVATFTFFIFAVGCCVEKVPHESRMVTFGMRC